MRAINNLTDVQIVLKDLLDKRDRDLVKAKDQRGNQIKNAGDAVDPQDLVTLRQLQDELRKFKKVINQTVINPPPGTGTTPPPVITPPPVVITPPGGITGPAMPGIPITEDLSGYIGGAFITEFTLAHLPIASTLNVQLNGTYQHEPGDIIVSGTLITFLTAPRLGDSLVVNYFY